MLLVPGNKVRFLLTEEEGVITELLDNGMFSVWLSPDTEIPAFPEDVVRIDRESSVKGKIIRAIPSKVETIPLAKRQYELIKNDGLQLAFVPVKRPDGITQRYQIYFLNTTPYVALFDFNIEVKGTSIKKINGKVDARKSTLVMDMQADYLSDNPTIKASCREVSTEGMSDWDTKELKIKPKSFFSKEMTAALIDRKAHVYKVFTEFGKEKQEESLASYTKKNAGKTVKPKQGLYRYWTGADVKTFAEFPLEIDLHIEKLMSDFNKLTSAQIFLLQLDSFDAYIQDAIRLGVERVYIIHGHGKGRLRDAVAQRLKKTSEVKKFQNEYHPKYGTGATEVYFR